MSGEDYRRRLFPNLVDTEAILVLTKIVSPSRAILLYTLPSKHDDAGEGQATMIVQDSYNQPTVHPFAEVFAQCTSPRSIRTGSCLAILPCSLPMARFGL